MQGQLQNTFFYSLLVPDSFFNCGYQQFLCHSRILFSIFILPPVAIYINTKLLLDY